MTSKEKLREEIAKRVDNTPTTFLVDDILTIVERERKEAAGRVMRAVEEAKCHDPLSKCNCPDAHFSQDSLYSIAYHAADSVNE